MADRAEFNERIAEIKRQNTIESEKLAKRAEEVVNRLKAMTAQIKDKKLKRSSYL